MKSQDLDFDISDIDEKALSLLDVSFIQNELDELEDEFAERKRELKRKLDEAVAKAQANGFSKAVLGAIKAHRDVYWLCPKCFSPSQTGPKIPDEQNKSCDCNVKLRPYLRA